MSIHVDNLVKSYSSGGLLQSIFDHAGFTVQAGTVAALVGSSGSGKTTLLNLISGIDNADAGCVEVAGIDVTTLKEPDRTLFRRRSLGFVFQFFNLIPTLTVAENIAFPLELNGIGDRDDRVARILAKVGLEHTRERYPETLSGGEQQRVAIARALVHGPAVLLADEPTGNLDEDTGSRVTDYLMELARDQGVTMLLVTHSESLSQQADSRFRLDHGHITPLS